MCTIASDNLKDLPMSSSPRLQGLAVATELVDVNKATSCRALSRGELGVLVPLRRKTSNRQKSKITCSTCHDVVPHKCGLFDTDRKTLTERPGNMVQDMSASKTTCIHDRRNKVTFSSLDMLQISSKVRVIKDGNLNNSQHGESEDPTEQPNGAEGRTMTEDKTESESVINSADISSSVATVNLADRDERRTGSQTESRTSLHIDFMGSLDESYSLSVEPCLSNHDAQIKTSAGNYSSSVDPVGWVSGVSSHASLCSSLSEASLTSEKRDDVYNTLQSPLNPVFVRMLSKYEDSISLRSNGPGSTPSVQDLRRYLTETTQSASQEKMLKPSAFAEIMQLGVIYEKIAHLDRDIRQCRTQIGQTATDFAELHKNSIGIANEISMVKKSVADTIKELDRVAYLDNLIDHLNEVNANMILKPFYVDIGAHETAV